MDMYDHEDDEQDETEVLQARFEALEAQSLGEPVNPIHPNRSVAAVLTVYGLLKDEVKAGWSWYAEHDVLYLAQYDELIELTDNDITQLIQCRVHCGEFGLEMYT